MSWKSQRLISTRAGVWRRFHVSALYMYDKDLGMRIYLHYAPLNWDARWLAYIWEKGPGVLWNAELVLDLRD